MLFSELNEEAYDKILGSPDTYQAAGLTAMMYYNECLISRLRSNTCGKQIMVQIFGIRSVLASPIDSIRRDEKYNSIMHLCTCAPPLFSQLERGASEFLINQPTPL